MRSLEVPWTTQPQAEVPIDSRWSMFRSVWLPSLLEPKYASTPGVTSRGVRDVGRVPRKPMALDFPSTVDVSVVPTPQGFAVSLPNNGAYAPEQNAFPTDIIVGSSFFTLLFVMRFRTLNGAGATNTIMSQRNSTGWIFSVVNGNYNWYDNNNSFNDIGLSATVGTNLVVILTGNIGPTPNVATLYENFRHTTLSIGATYPPTPDALLQLGAFSGPNGPMDGTLSMWGIADRALTQQQAFELVDNPWQIFAPTRRMSFPFMSVAAAAPTASQLLMGQACL